MNPLLRSHPCRFAVAFVAFALLLTPGCKSGTTVERASVSGTVTFDGQPVESGTITFVPAAGVVGAPAELRIQNGKYSTTDAQGVVVGNNDVRILATKKTGKQFKNPNNEMEDEVVQFIPEKYNEKTELQETVKPGENTFDFDLTP